MRSFTLPLPPGINATYKIGYKKLLKTDAAKDWEEECGYILIREKTKPQLEGDLWVEIIMYLEDPYKRDIDMGIKGLLDLFERMGIYKNDKNIVRLIVMKKPNDVLIKNAVHVAIDRFIL